MTDVITSHECSSSETNRITDTCDINIYGKRRMLFRSIKFMYSTWHVAVMRFICTEAERMTEIEATAILTQTPFEAIRDMRM